MTGALGMERRNSMPGEMTSLTGVCSGGQWTLAGFCFSQKIEHQLNLLRCLLIEIPLVGEILPIPSGERHYVG